MDYKPSFLFKNKHINTCFPTIFRNIEVEYRRERINTPDLDFLDIDWIKNGNNKVIVLCHGLEGSSKSKCFPSSERRALADGSVPARRSSVSNRGFPVVGIEDKLGFDSS